ncbi:histidine triad nucleotide-binding protein [Pelotomaculum propionicicum]|uniref:histidine triad nucleotide-binding protein n=1 Tax=Pelotomaculum propionicicum TaxID=258475 RepID=UPI003B800977
MSDCIFCKIASKEIPADIVYEDGHLVVFKDVKPVAPDHLLLIPKKHFSSPLDFGEEDIETAGRLMVTAARIAREMGFAEKGFRVVCNCGRDGGQTVSHIHYHLLAGRALQWPPG